MPKPFTLKWGAHGVMCGTTSDLAWTIRNYLDRMHIGMLWTIVPSVLFASRLLGPIGQGVWAFSCLTRNDFDTWKPA